MLALALYSGVPVSRELAQLQAAGRRADQRSCRRTDPRRVRFDRLHRTSTTLMTVNMGLGLVLLFWYARVATQQSTVDSSDAPSLLDSTVN